MTEAAKQIFILAGCNGSGKTTLAFKLLPDFLSIYDFVNADEIAKELSPTNPESVSLTASKIMIRRLLQLRKDNKNFSFETTLSGKNYSKFLNACKAEGYKIYMFFLWLPSPAVAIERVRKRVAQGGHNIPEDVIRRRYKAGISNLLNIYLKQVDNVFVVVSSAKKQTSMKNLIAKKTARGKLIVYNDQIWKKILKTSS